VPKASFFVPGGAASIGCGRPVVAEDALLLVGMGGRVLR